MFAKPLRTLLTSPSGRANRSESHIKNQINCHVQCINNQRVQSNVLTRQHVQSFTRRRWRISLHSMGHCVSNTTRDDHIACPKWIGIPMMTRVRTIGWIDGKKPFPRVICWSRPYSLIGLYSITHIVSRRTRTAHTRTRTRRRFITPRIAVCWVLRFVAVVSYSVCSELHSSHIARMSDVRNSHSPTCGLRCNTLPAYINKPIASARLCIYDEWGASLMARVRALVAES